MIDLSEDEKKEPQVFEINGTAPEEPGEEMKTTEAPPQQNEVDPSQEKVQALGKDLLYLRAEFDNYRRQSIKERSDLLKYAGERLARDLLGVVDIFDSALDMEVNQENWEEFVKGMELTRAELINLLAKHGISEDVSKEFDPRIHEALSSQATDDVPAGNIVQVLKKPYKFHDRVLRVGQVVVATARPKEES